MTIKLNAFTLCDGADRDPGKLVGPSGLAGGVAFAMQTVEAIRAAAAKKIGRGNKSSRFAWKCSAAFADEATATAFLAAFVSGCPASGVLYFDAVAMGNGVVNFEFAQRGAGLDLSFSAEVGA